MELFNTNEPKCLDITISKPDKQTSEINNAEFKSKFNDDEWLVIGLYMVHGDIKMAYNQVFISESSLERRGKAVKFFKRDDVILEIKRRRRIVIDNNSHLIHRLIREYELLAFSNMDDVASWTSENLIMKPSAILDRNCKATIQSIKSNRWGIEIKLHPKQSALDTLSKMLGILRDTIDLNTKDISEPTTDPHVGPVVILPNNNRG